MHLHLDRRRPAGTAPRAAAARAEDPPARRAVGLLRQLPLVEGVLGGAAEAALREARVVEQPAGTVLFTAGEPADRLYVLVDGRVRLMLGQGPSARKLPVLERGDTIGLAALLRGDLYPVGAAVVDDARLVVLPEPTMRRLIAEQPAIAARLVGDMGAKLARFVRDIGGFTPRSARARVARMLHDLHRAAADASGELSYGESKRVIASRLAMTPETLSRELHSLSEQGLIESRRTRVRVLDPARLQQVADEAAPAAGPA
jgi:CRP-like cAMP-binding protein